MASSRRTHKMRLRKAPANANETANSGISQLPTPTPPVDHSDPQVSTRRGASTSQLSIPQVVTPQANPQNNSPLFSLPAELRNHTVEVVTASGAMLRMCRFAQQEIQGIFDRSSASPRFWEHNIFAVNLDDSRYDEWVRLREEVNVASLNETTEDGRVLVDWMSYWPYGPYVSDIYLKLGDKQLTAMTRLIVSVKADNGSCEAHLIERTLPCGAVCWYLDQTASTWNGILVSQDNLDQDSLDEYERIVASNAKFPLPMVNSFPFREENDYSNVELFHNSTLTVKATGGGNYEFMELYEFMEKSEEIHQRLQTSRTILEIDLRTKTLRSRPQPGVTWNHKTDIVTRNLVKQDQLDIFMEHCWLVFRARQNT